ncbi:MAG: hypothetical protein ACK4E8_07165 [Lacibacter sp.]|jgi:hypothetical protein
MKYLVNTWLLFVIFSAHAQNRSGALASVRPVLDQVVAQYPTNYSTLRGERLSSDPSTIVYTSNIKLPGAEEAKVLGYPGKKKTYWVWECKYREIEDLQELKRVYRALYNDISGNALFKNPNSRYEPVAPYEAPAETQRLWSNLLRLSDRISPNNRLVIDLVAENVNFAWVIWVRVYDREQDADMRPDHPADDYR